MPKQLIIAEQHRIAAVFSEDQIQEIIVAKGSHQVSDIYLGIVENVLPGIDAAFVNIGDAERNGFIHVTDLGPLKLKRTSGAITELLAPQQKVLVQVMKEPTGSKGPRLTGNTTLPGRYLVLMPFGKGVNLSRRIKNEPERNRLRALAILIKPSGMGLLVRTEAEGMSEEAIMEDLEALQKQWENILREASSTRAPALLNRDDDFIQRVLRDMYSADVNRIVVDSSHGIKRVKQNLMNWYGGKTPSGVLIDHHRERTSILEYFRVNAAIREALKPRVDLPSGGYIIIQPTEALTVIDVNSGSFTRSATARETVLWTNCEAATEIARQLCLRNLAGVIIVDFIDMDKRQDQLQVLEHFNKALKSDKARPQIAQLSELGLVELTRKRQGKNIYELFSRPCPTCGGLGHLVHLPGELEPEEEDIDRSFTTTITPQREYRPPEPAAREIFEPEINNDLQEMDIMNHPSYQELGDPNARRRRRRRIGLDGEIKEVNDIRETRIPGSFISASTQLELFGDSDLREPNESSYSRSISKENRPILDRNRPLKREIPKPVTDRPEVISVEMTHLEQEVYAWMGVSPLVRAEREIKNPKSAIISVRAPGEAEPVQTVVDVMANTPRISSPSYSYTEVLPEENTPETVPEIDDDDFSAVASDNFEESDISLRVVNDENSVDLVTSSNDASEMEMTSIDSDANVPTRRRRRRSSALEG
mgnify:CR=1 FL=1